MLSNPPTPPTPHPPLRSEIGQVTNLSYASVLSNCLKVAGRPLQVDVKSTTKTRRMRRTSLGSNLLLQEPPAKVLFSFCPLPPLPPPPQFYFRSGLFSPPPPPLTYVTVTSKGCRRQKRERERERQWGGGGVAISVFGDEIFQYCLYLHTGKLEWPKLSSDERARRTTGPLNY